MSKEFPRSEYSAGTDAVAGWTNELVRSRKIRLSQHKKASTAVDRALAAVEPKRLRGQRDIITPQHPLARELCAAALQLNEHTNYRLKQAPHFDELAGLVRFRFRALDNIARGPWTKERGSQDPLLIKASKLIKHLTVDQIQSAFEVVYENMKGAGANNKAVKHAWNRDLTGLRRSFENVALQTNDSFRAAFGPLIDKIGPLEAVCSVLDQAFEFECKFEYLQGALLEIKSITGLWRSKGEHFSDISPNLLFLAIDKPELIGDGDWRQNGRVNFEAIDRKRPSEHDIDAPEGERWHRIMGYDPLSYILHYLFGTADRFGPYMKQVTSNRFNAGSALFRFALNILAHIDFDEAQAHLLARVSHWRSDNIPWQLQRKIEHKDFNLFKAKANSLAPIINKFRLGEGIVERRRKKHRIHVQDGLLDESINPYVRALYYPQGWSQKPQINYLREVWRRAVRPLARIDSRYVPKKYGGNSLIRPKDFTFALNAAAALIETPNPAILCRLFALPKSSLKTTVPVSGDL
tara:strand:- start:12199 stop:13761 length:1563 start_codon:yes stop_codon:yes gene_type:complete